ncbi:MAG: dTMP kinase [Clostridiales bacterium]|nr:dTMP kinase [Clostridiales bacterium]
MIEGLDGSGTTTQTAMLKDWFEGEGAVYGKCVATCEPTQGPAGSMARLALNHRLTLDSAAMALLFAADRADHVYKEDDGRQEPGVFHLLGRGQHVLSDRYLLSSLAYQSLDLPMEWVLEINARAIVPDLTVYIDIDPQVSRRRMQANRSHEDLFEGADTQARVRGQYEKAIALLRGRGHDIRRVAGDRPAAEVFQAIIVELLPLLRRRQED